MFDLEIIGEASIAEEEIHKISKLICEAEDPLHDYQICLKIVDSEEMQNYNRSYRGKDGTTDILSFISDEIILTDVSQDLEDGLDVNLPLRLCDIIVDTNQLIRQKGNRTLDDEFRIVLVHGLLHLVGYDHIRTRDAEEMRIKEEYYIKQLQGEKISGRR
jgi:probable rRNA maturation factor